MTDNQGISPKHLRNLGNLPNKKDPEGSNSEGGLRKPSFSIPEPGGNDFPSPNLTNTKKAPDYIKEIIDDQKEQLNQSLPPNLRYNPIKDDLREAIRKITDYVFQTDMVAGEPYVNLRRMIEALTARSNQQLLKQIVEELPEKLKLSKKHLEFEDGFNEALEQCRTIIEAKIKEG